MIDVVRREVFLRSGQRICPECRGSGWANAFRREMCVGCMGFGYIYVYEPMRRRVEDMVTLTLACPYCGQVNTAGVARLAVWSVLCSGCRQQFLVRGGEVWLHPEREDCGHACGHAEPYGYVPEAGCPVHDAPEEVEHGNIA